MDFQPIRRMDFQPIRRMGFQPVSSIHLTSLSYQAVSSSRSRCLFTTLILVCSFFAIGTTVAAAQKEDKAEPSSPYRYFVDLTQSKNHYINVTIEVDATGDTTELMMAVWTPGSYLVREYSKHLDQFKATSETGAPLKSRKVRKNRWLIDNAESKTVVVSYRLYCNQLSVRTNFAGNEYAVLNGAPTFLTVVDQLDHPHEVTLKLPKVWSRSATSLLPAGDRAHQYLAATFDELVDSPIVAGNVQVYPFDVKGVPHQLVNIGEAGYWDGAKAAADLKKVVIAHQKMWKEVPYDRYLFLNVIGAGGGGLEHDNCTLVMTSRWSFRDESRYLRWLSLCSHEFFHTWNVRRLRPEPLVKYDYENEVYTDGLWIAEGITSYYEDLALVRAGLMDKQEFMSAMNRNIASVYRSEGRKVQSLRDSSFDSWIKFYRPDENSSNTSVSYYSKGAVVAFLLDAKIRKLTKNRKSLDDLMRHMYKQHSKTGFTRDDFRAAAGKIADADLNPWFERAIDSTEELEYDESLTFLGVTIPSAVKPKEDESKKESKTAEPDEDGDKKNNSKKKKADGNDTDKKAKKKKSDGVKKFVEQAIDGAKEALTPTPKPDIRPSANLDEDKPKKRVPWVGARTSAGRVTSVEPGSPAFEMGIGRGDEILAVNGMRIDSLSERLSQFNVGDKVELLISRNDILSTLDIELGESVRESWSIGWEKNLKRGQTVRRAKWLGLEVPPPEKKVEKAKSKDGEQRKDMPAKPKKKRKKKAGSRKS